MRWTRVILSVGGLMFALAVSGCRSPQPEASLRPIVAPASTDQLGLQLSEARLEQQRLDKELEKTRDDLYRTALALKQIKDRLEAIAVYSVTNVAKMRVIEDQIRETRRLVGEGSSAEANVLRASLEREQQNQDRLKALIAERDKEVSDLRSTVAAQRDAINRMPAPAPASAAAQPQASTAAKAAPPASADSGTTSVYRIVAEGQRALKAGDLQRARNLFESARKQQPALSSALLGLAAIAYQVNDLTEARRLVDDVLDADKKNAQALGLRGLIRWREGFARDGVRDCERAVELDPMDPLLHKFYGITLNARDKTDEAIREMRKAVELDPTDAEAKLNLAILLATGSSPALAEAQKYYEQALAAGVSRDPALDKLLGLSK